MFDSGGPASELYDNGKTMTAFVPARATGVFAQMWIGPLPAAGEAPKTK